MYPPRIVLVPTDLSPEDEPVLARASELARETGAHVHLLHVFDSLVHDLPLDGAESASTRTLRARMRAVARDTLQRLATTHFEGVRVTVEQRLAPHPGPSIAACAREVGADLVVMGTHGRSGLQRLLLGSVAGAVTARAPCPVEVVRCAPESAPWAGGLESVRERIRMAWV